MIMRPVAVRVFAAFLSAVLAGGFGAFFASEASAHAALVQSDPADGGVVAEAPQHIHLRFNEPVSPLVLKFVAADGSAATLDRGAVAAHDTTLTVDLPAGLGEGTHLLSWRVVSEDGHPVAGSILFSVGAPSNGALAGAATSADPVVAGAIWTVKFLLYLGLFVGVGGAVFHGTMAPLSRGPRLISESLIGVGLLAAVVSVGLQGLDALGLAVADIGQADAWLTGLATSFGRTVVVSIVVFGLAVAALRTGKRAVAASASLLALIGVGVALASSGHASAAAPQYLTRPAVFIHGVGLTFWIGSLVPLGLILWRGGPDSAAILSRYGFAILPVFVALIVAGILLAVVQVGQVSALWTTPYGEVLLIKSALLVGLFTLAALNRFRLTPAVARGEAGAGRRFGRSIAVEVVLACVILGVAALWRFTPPPRSAAAAETVAEAASVHLHSPTVMAMLWLDPGRSGPMTATIEVMDGEASPLDPMEVSLAMANGDAGIEPIRRAAVRTGEGIWKVEDLTLPLAGAWSVRVEILVSTFEKAILEETVEIK